MENKENKHRKMEEILGHLSSSSYSLSFPIFKVSRAGLKSVEQESKRCKLWPGGSTSCSIDDYIVFFFLSGTLIRHEESVSHSELETKEKRPPRKRLSS